MAALKRIQKELKNWMRIMPASIAVGPPAKDDMFHWEGMFHGLPDGPFCGGVFFFSIDFPSDFPSSPPKVTFSTKIFHPNIDSNGNIGLGILKEENWSPKITIFEVMRSISDLLWDPNPDDPLVPEIADMYKTNRSEYESTARSWTKEYAQY